VLLLLRQRCLAADLLDLRAAASSASNAVW
jgi:hypothetical protein